jgi:hypothetical protein
MSCHIRLTNDSDYSTEDDELACKEMALPATGKRLEKTFMTVAVKNEMLGAQL